MKFVPVLRNRGLSGAKARGKAFDCKNGQLLAQGVQHTKREAFLAFHRQGSKAQSEYRHG